VTSAPSLHKVGITLLLALVLCCCSHGSAFAWHDKTHLAIARAAGHQQWYNAAAADVVKEKAPFEQFNHWYNNLARQEITPRTVLSQIDRYNDPKDGEGHLYGAILAALRSYESGKSSGKYADYNLALCAHYLGDLTQPLHNIPHEQFNRTHHLDNDGVVEEAVLTRDGLKKLKGAMYKIELGGERFEDNLAREIARIANATRALGYRLEQQNRNMTKEEAYLQLGHSASLLKAVLAHYNPKPEGAGAGARTRRGAGMSVPGVPTGAPD
jgi:hypothetical protein